MMYFEIVKKVIFLACFKSGNASWIVTLLSGKK